MNIDIKDLQHEATQALKACERGDISAAQLTEKMDDIERRVGARRAGMYNFGMADPAMRGNTFAGTPVGTHAGVSTAAAIGIGMAQQLSPSFAGAKSCLPTPLHASDDEWRMFHEAGKRSLPSVSTTLTLKSVEDQISTKADTAPSPATEYNTSTSSFLIPPILRPDAYRLLFEPVRVLSYLPVETAPASAQVSWLRHESNTNSAAAVAELGEKPDLGPVFTEHTTTHSVIAATLYLSRQLYNDYGSLSVFAPQELTSALINEENNQLLTGDGTGANLTGFFNTSGTLTYSAPSGTSNIDALLTAANAVRTGAAFGTADLIVIHPDDWLDIKKSKGTDGRYLLQPNDPNAIGTVTNGFDNLFGIRVVPTTQCTKGKALVLDTKIAATVFLREGLELLQAIGIGQNQTEYTLRHNAIAFRAEERFSLAVTRPKAVNIVTFYSGS